MSFAAAAAGGTNNTNKNRVSWNRSLSTRGRTSIAVGSCLDVRPQGKQARRKGKPALPKSKGVQPVSFEKEREYFQEVDAFELLEESPSPKHFSTWAMGNQNDTVPIPHLCSRLEKWLLSKKFNYSCGPSSTLSKILETPYRNLESLQGEVNFSILSTPKKSSFKDTSGFLSIQSRFNEEFITKDVHERDINSQKSNAVSESVKNESCEDIEVAVKKLSLASTSASLVVDHVNPISTLLAVCGQSAPTKLLDLFSKYSDPENIVKVGEGTFGEAFLAGNTVCKIVPIDGDLKVNGEAQKVLILISSAVFVTSRLGKRTYLSGGRSRIIYLVKLKSEELLEEVVLSWTLNHLRRNEGDTLNACTTFVEMFEIKVCQGPYDAALIQAWEDWDDKHCSENDNPEEFPENQRYIVFVLQHGGKDLESFVLLNINEARSLLVQVTAGLAVAEAAYEFEHRDLHWGNVLLSRNDSVTMNFLLDGKQIFVRTFGLSVTIIDFTLSRINTGEDIFFLDLSQDPELFNGPKGDKQFDTYRKMKKVTEDQWEGSFPKTNVLWLVYLVDMLLLKKTFDRSSKDERDLRSLKKRLDKYNSAKEAIFDPFFSDLIVDRPL
ncbi:serine/threonine-protein kinase haspin-like [Citrus sinensis]|uniref:Serine/threonine-protein kinase haspin-like n=1 Tax=Citrus sinensis TaxID=2711 RepID=A0ACB8JMU0_CITSI|nr:serine/threonine-protein kinase haspin-like [Citrus sinensis]